VERFKIVEHTASAGLFCWGIKIQKLKSIAESRLFKFLPSRITRDRKKWQNFDNLPKDFDTPAR